MPTFRILITSKLITERASVLFHAPHCTCDPTQVTLSEGPYQTAEIKGLPRIFHLDREHDLSELRKEIERRMVSRFAMLFSNAAMLKSLSPGDCSDIVELLKSFVSMVDEHVM
jgi:hypothetical protein